MHARTKIKNAVVAALKGATDAKKNVFASRAFALGDDEIPAILVYTKQEQVSEATISRPRTQIRELSVVIEIYTKALLLSDDLADNIASQVEGLIYSNADLNGLVKDISLDSSDTYLLQENEFSTSVCSLTYVATYQVKEGSPQHLL